MALRYIGREASTAPLDKAGRAHRLLPGFPGPMEKKEISENKAPCHSGLQNKQNKYMEAMHSRSLALKMCLCLPLEGVGFPEEQLYVILHL